ncbi:MAG TPA: hypothetical protein VFY88_17265 [Intrasporangium sp.]|nr:hypothetical protein [Intrasporangium sp.]
MLRAGPSATTNDDSGRPHTVQLTTPTGHRYVSSAPPVLPGHEAIAAAVRDRLRREILSDHGFHVHRIAA